MPRVRILPPEIISKIAAGEVVERPASVVKELIENAFDAQTQSIEVHLKDAGKALIHIKDTGSGIAKEDIETLFQRHATSKIRDIDDLYAIRSLGFRGEALYSIGAVADVILRSKTNDAETGWEMHVRGGEKLNFKPVTMPVGTELEIKELFFNTPARKKFLKSNNAEIRQILDTFIPYTLLYPECRFRLTHQGKDLVDLQPGSNAVSRIAHALNLDEKHIIETRKDIPDRKIAVRMILGDMNIRRARRDMHFIFVNNRPVQNRNLGFHLNQIYRLVFPPDQYPFFAVYIDVPADDVDVNIHPSKREVKIRDEQALASLLRTMCEAALMTRGQAKEVLPPKQDEWDESRVTVPTENRQEYPSTTESRTAFEVAEPVHWQSPEIREDFFIQKKENLQEKLSRARYIGPFIKKFLLFEVDDILLIVDQHAAQERITFEKLCKQIENGQLEVQNLLSPVLVRVSAQEMLAWEEAKEKLEGVGLSTTQFDDQTVAVHTHPQLLTDTEKAVREILAEKDVARCDPNTIATWACKASIRAGDSLNKEQAEHQRKELLACKDPFTCPHGRPTIIELSEKFLDKQFLRT